MLTKLRPTPDWDSITPEQFVEFRAAQDRLRRSVLLRPLTGRPDRAARIADHTVDLPGRRLNVRVYRPELESSPLPLVIAFHGGGLISGAPDQDDWLLAHLAVHTPAVVASLDYRLAPEHPVPAPVQDAYEAVPRLVDSAARWGADRDRLALLGSSAGATLAALTAIRAAELSLELRAQVLINPQLDWTDRAFEYPSFTENADSPTASRPNAALFRVSRSPNPSIAGRFHRCTAKDCRRSRRHSYWPPAWTRSRTSPRPTPTACAALVSR
jgi:acetyl esterase